MRKSLLFLVFLFGASFSRAESTAPPAFVITPGQIYEASVQFHADGHASLQVNLVAAKRIEWAAFTGRNLDKLVRVIVNGKPLVEAVVKQQMLAGSLDIPCDSPESALSLAKTLMAK